MGHVSASPARWNNPYSAPAHQDDREGEIRVFDPKSDSHERLLPGLHGRYLSTGHLVFVRRPDSADRRVHIVGGANRSTTAASAWHAHLDTGRHSGKFGAGVHGRIRRRCADVPTRRTVTQQRDLLWVDRDAREELVGVERRRWSNPRVSPDGRYIAMVVRPTFGGENSNVYTWDSARASLTQLTSDSGPNWQAVWFPDGKRVAFSVDVEGLTYAYWLPADGSGAPRPMRQDEPTRGVPVAFTPDGSLLTWGIKPSFGLLAGTGRAPLRYLWESSALERNPVVSPNGRWLAFESNRSGRFEIYVRSFPSVNEEWPITDIGACCPVWARDESAVLLARQRRRSSIDHGDCPRWSWSAARLGQARAGCDRVLHTRQLGHQLRCRT